MKDYSDISIVIPLYWDSLPCAHWNLKRLLNIYNPKKIVLIGPDDIQKELPVLEKVEFIDEDSVLYVNCDINGDGKVNTKDISALKRLIAGA